MLGTVCLEKEGVSLHNLPVRLLEVEQVRMGWQVRQLLSHLVGEELLVVEERGNVDEGQKTQLTSYGVVLK